MKKKQPKQREIEKANSEIEIPVNIDFIEINMTHENLDKVAQKNANILNQQNDPVIRKHLVRRQEKLLRKVFKAASRILTDNQFKIFTYRYVYQITESEIAKQISRHQTYVSLVLKNSIKKIQKQLRLKESLKEFNTEKKNEETKKTM